MFSFSKYYLQNYHVLILKIMIREQAGINYKIYSNHTITNDFNIVDKTEVMYELPESA